jgi:hypothetical protein
LGQKDNCFGSRLIALGGRYSRKTLPCGVVNLTDKGLQLRVEGSFAPVDILHLEFLLTEQERFESFGGVSNLDKFRLFY